MPVAFIGLIRASHPEPGAAVTAGSALLAISAGHDASGVATVAATIAASQLAVGWHNDWLDAARDTAAGRTDKPIVTGAISRRAVGIAFGVAVVVTVGLAVLSGPWAALVAAAGLVSCLGYNWPLKSTVLSAIPYIISFAALPAFVVLALPASPTPPWWLLAAGAMLGAGAHFANVLSDLEADARTGVRGLPHRLGARWSAIAAGSLLAAASAMLVFGPAGPPKPVALAGMAAAIAVLLRGGYAQWRAPASRSAFRAVIVAALINVALLVGSGAVITIPPEGVA